MISDQKVCFGEKGKLNPEALKFCELLCFNPADLSPRAKGDFEHPNERIAQIRHEHYEKKRKDKLQLLAEAVKFNRIKRFESDLMPRPQLSQLSQSTIVSSQPSCIEFHKSRKLASRMLNESFRQKVASNKVGLRQSLNQRISSIQHKASLGEQRVRKMQREVQRD